MFFQALDSSTQASLSRGQAIAILAAVLLLLVLAFLVGTIALAWRKGMAGFMQEGYVGVLHRFSHYSPKLCEGFYLRFPFFGFVTKVYVRSRTYDLEAQQAIIRGTETEFDATVDWRVVDPYTVVANYQDYELKAHQLLRESLVDMLMTVETEAFLTQDPAMLERLFRHMCQSMQQSGFEVLRVGFTRIGVPNVVTAALAGNYLAGKASDTSRARLDAFLSSGEAEQYRQAARESLPQGATEEQVTTLAMQLLTRLNQGQVTQMGFNIEDKS